MLPSGLNLEQLVKIKKGMVKKMCGQQVTGKNRSFPRIAKS
jgi:hypothetical protein